MVKITVLATEVQMLQSLIHQILPTPNLLPTLLEMLHILLHQCVAMTPVSTNNPNSKISSDVLIYVVQQLFTQQVNASFININQININSTLIC